jgi:hypothetical protein
MWTPAALARRMPSPVRARISSRSNSAAVLVERQQKIDILPKSLRLDSCKLDHLAPFLDIFGDKSGEFVR